MSYLHDHAVRSRERRVYDDFVGAARAEGRGQRDRRVGDELVLLLAPYHWRSSVLLEMVGEQASQALEFRRRVLLERLPTLQVVDADVEVRTGADGVERLEAGDDVEALSLKS